MTSIRLRWADKVHATTGETIRLQAGLRVSVVNIFPDRVSPEEGFVYVFSVTDPMTKRVYHYTKKLTVADFDEYRE